jgi:hypothetical protein
MVNLIGTRAISSSSHLLSLLVQPTWHQYGQARYVHTALGAQCCPDFFTSGMDSLNLLYHPKFILTPRCRHFIRFEGAMTLIGIHVVAIMMLLRYAAPSKLISRLTRRQHQRAVRFKSCDRRLRVRTLHDHVHHERVAADPWRASVDSSCCAFCVLMSPPAVAHNPASGVHGTSSRSPAIFKLNDGSLHHDFSAEPVRSQLTALTGIYF